MKDILRKIEKYRAMLPIYAVMILFSYHLSLLLFINSTNLSRFWSAEEVGVLYLIGSIVTIVLFLTTSHILQKIHVFRLFTGFLLLETIGTAAMAFGNSGLVIGAGFVLIQLASPLLFFLLDIYLQTVTTDPEKVGGIRSVFLTLTSITFITSPLISAALISTYSYSAVYTVSLLFLIPVIIIAYRYFRAIPDVTQEEITSIPKIITEYLSQSDLRRVFESNVILKVFYAIMTIYLPLYMIETFGFNWDQIGIMLTVMLLPFLFFSVPYGTIADRYLGEKELMIMGFIISGLSILTLSTIENPSFWIITGLLFLSRVGASAIDTMTETYFFKKVAASSTDLISFFRITNPLSFIVAPIIAGIILLFASYSTVFLVLGIITLCGIIPSALIRDTK